MTRIAWFYALSAVAIVAGVLWLVFGSEHIGEGLVSVGVFAALFVSLRQRNV